MVIFNTNKVVAPQYPKKRSLSTRAHLCNDHRRITNSAPMGTTKTRLCSTSSRFANLDSNKSFLEWFSGFSDAEGCFSIVKEKMQNFRFNFKIDLHKDDVEILYFIAKTLGVGKIYLYGNYARFSVPLIL